LQLLLPALREQAEVGAASIRSYEAEGGRFEPDADDHGVATPTTEDCESPGVLSKKSPARPNPKTARNDPKEPS